MNFKWVKFLTLDWRGSAKQKEPHYESSKFDEDEKTAKCKFSLLQVRDKKFEGYSEFKTNQGAAKKKKALENKAAKQLEEEYILNL